MSSTQQGPLDRVTHAPRIPQELALQLHEELKGFLSHLKPAHGALLGTALERVSKPLPGVKVTLSFDLLPEYKFWVGALDGRLCLAATIEAPLARVRETFDISPKQLWYPGWDLHFKETPLALGGHTLVTARIAHVPIPSAVDPAWLDPDVTFPALDLFMIAQACVQIHQRAQLQLRLH